MYFNAFLLVNMINCKLQKKLLNIIDLKLWENDIYKKINLLSKFMFLMCTNT